MPKCRLDRLLQAAWLWCSALFWRIATTGSFSRTLFINGSNNSSASSCSLLNLNLSHHLQQIGILLVRLSAVARRSFGSWVPVVDPITVRHFCIFIHWTSLVYVTRDYKKSTVPQEKPLTNDPRSILDPFCSRKPCLWLPLEENMNSWRASKPITSLTHCYRSSMDTESRESGSVPKASTSSVRKYNSSPTLLINYPPANWSLSGGTLEPPDPQHTSAAERASDDPRDIERAVGNQGWPFSLPVSCLRLPTCAFPKPRVQWT